MQRDPESLDNLNINKSPLNEVHISMFLVQLREITAGWRLFC